MPASPAKAALSLSCRKKAKPGSFAGLSLHVLFLRRGRYGGLPVREGSGRCEEMAAQGRHDVLVADGLEAAMTMQLQVGGHLPHKKIFYI